MRYYNASIRNLNYRLRRFKDILSAELAEIIVKHEDEIVNMITKDQLYRRGINGKGKKIASYRPYTETTKRIKKQKGQPTTRVTLKDTGEFYSSFFVVVTDDGFYIDAYDDKKQELVDKYGEEIFRLTNENLTKLVRKYLRPDLQKRFKEYLKNG